MQIFLLVVVSLYAGVICYLSWFKVDVLIQWLRLISKIDPSTRIMLRILGERGLILYTRFLYVINLGICAFLLITATKTAR
jgi:hypothetical protein